MSKDLSYRLIYHPEVNKKTYINYLYSDNKVHFKFLDINRKHVLKGFEQKLNYLMTYLFNFSFAPTILSGVVKDKLQADLMIKEFLKSPEIIELQNIVSWKIGDCDFKGFKPLLNKKNPEKFFGELSFSTVPLETSECGLISKGSLQIFLRKLKTDLVNFLFDDGYMIEIYKPKKDITLNDKFIKKSIKKHNKITANVNSLW